MTPTEIKNVLASLGGGANKRLGQHFLVDRATLEEIVKQAEISPGERVLEIGPGLGVLTRALIEAGANVTAIERDRRFIEHLRSDLPLKIRGNEGVMIVSGDAAELEWEAYVGDDPWSFVSNLPYAITSLALRKALWSPHPPRIVVALVQREVAERAVARDGKTSLLSLMVALASSEARIVRRVPAGAFFPPPKVESAVLRICPMSWTERRERWGIDPEKIMKIAKVGFAHPRKLLASNVKDLVEAQGYSVLDAMRDAEVPFKVRAEDLSPDMWARFAKKVFQQ